MFWSDCYGEAYRAGHGRSPGESDMLAEMVRRPTALIAVLALVLLPGYLLTARKLLDHDCFIMGEVTQRVIKGEQLYGRACWENKPPLALLWYAVPLEIAPGSYTALQLMLFGLVAVEALLASASCSMTSRPGSAPSRGG